MQLNYRLRTSKNKNKTIPIVMLHGLFGNLNNLGSIAAHLSQYYNIIQIDLRNHGHSPHDEMMNYMIMAQDVLDTLDYLAIMQCFVIGHSMGGKVAMALSIIASKRINKVIVIDIAPIKYDTQKHNKIFEAITYINKHKIQNKNNIFNIMEKNHIRKNIILFLLQSFYQGTWIFNFNSIQKNYKNINNWEILQIYRGSILFIKGESSSYINKIGLQSIYEQFPNAYIRTIPNSSHWVHYEHPISVFNLIYKFLY